MPRTTLARLAAVLVLGPWTTASAQRTPVLNLERPTWSVQEPFTAISSLRELESGAVLVTDLAERSLQLVLPGGRGTRLLGRPGSGPREYTAPTTLIALPGDSTLLLDRDARRYLLISPAGDLLDARRLPDAMLSGAEHVRGADRLGRLYFQASGLPAPDGLPFVAIRRWDRRTAGLDSAAAVRMPNPQPVKLPLSPAMERESPGMVNTVRRIMPFTPEDEWAVAPSGRLAILRADPYRLEWTELDGRVRRGEIVTHEPVPVTEADRRVREPDGPPYRLTYPTHKPPFRSGLVIDNEDNVWVRREKAAGTKIQPWDVFGSTGDHRGTVMLPTNNMIVAITRRFVYVSRADEDDLRWLEAYAR